MFFFGIKEVVVPVLFQGRYLIIICLHCSLKTKIPNCRPPSCVTNKKTRSDGGSRQTAPPKIEGGRQYHRRKEEAKQHRSQGGKPHTSATHTSQTTHTQTTQIPNTPVIFLLPPAARQTIRHKTIPSSSLLSSFQTTHAQNHTLPSHRPLNRTPLDHALLNQSLFFFSETFPSVSFHFNLVCEDIFGGTVMFFQSNLV